MKVRKTAEEVERKGSMLNKGKKSIKGCVEMEEKPGDVDTSAPLRYEPITKRNRGL